MREHQSLPWQGTDDLPSLAKSDRGIVFEQNIILSADDGQLLKAHPIKLCLKEALPDVDKEIF